MNTLSSIIGTKKIFFQKHFCLKHLIEAGKKMFF
jgi:hypothetical protein